MKKCKSCQKEINNKASKCPYCQTDQRNWFRRHPILTVLIVLFILPIVISTLSLDSYKSERSKTKTEKTTTDLKAEKEESKSATQVLEDLSNILNQANQKVGFQLYKGVIIEKHGAYWAIFTISDDWYNLEPYVQERLVKIAVSYYKEMEGGLNSLAEVSLEDQFGKEVATGWYSSVGIKVEIFK